MTIILFNNYPFKKAASFYLPKDTMCYNQNPFDTEFKDSERTNKVYVYYNLCLQRSNRIDPSKVFKLFISYSCYSCSVDIVLVSEFEYHASKILT